MTLPVLGPVTHSGATIRLRPPSILDGRAWSALRHSDAIRLRSEDDPGEHTDHDRWARTNTADAWLTMHHHLRIGAAAGTYLSWVIEINRRFAGQAEIFGLTGTPHIDRAGRLGVWLGREFEAHRVGTYAAALVCEHAAATGVITMEALIADTNTASMAGVRRIGFVQQPAGTPLASRWFSHLPPAADHQLFALDLTEVTEGSLQQLIPKDSTS